ncbi:prolyl-tRNA synthetase [Delitschia confertaspora ATCC 74209]|uniref:proline--tRNA ligase n=1 Tax=Delitschia confertaspora ATCC 74209 TaxID=1513339 RepID=A0A9P4MU48_9PLEO|nr:prolyl-tRNA synthetase [Delitschia confertaspora ATCC 74209]
MWTQFRVWPHQAKLPLRASRNIRCLHIDGRNRVSQFWTPTVAKDAGSKMEKEDSHALLIRAGYLFQSHSGIFHLLPLGLRVQEKLERLIDKHMRSIGASKLSLSSITSEALWKKTDRYSTNSELLRVKDRRDSGFLLSPTHEEEITEVVKNGVLSYKSLPLRLYQISRKYRDEKRPRQGLLRAKEFLMKDLYTFDYSHEKALETYQQVRSAYSALFNELKIPYVVADADSGAMGGNLSHEYHFLSPQGEDNVWSCNSCDYVANEELAAKKPADSVSTATETVQFVGINLDRTTRITIHIPRPRSLPSSSCSEELPWNKAHSYLNLHALKSVCPDLDTGIEASSLSHLLTKTTQTHHVYDLRVSPPPSASPSSYQSPPTDLTALHPGDACPRCSIGTLSVSRAIEVGHTFHLGTRYSVPLEATVAVPNTPTHEPMHMGCHGIGVSRLIGSIALLLSSPSGLHWPRAITPFEVLVFPTSKGISDSVVEQCYDELAEAGVDVMMDDRGNMSTGWKLKDADLIGYPVVVVLGKRWVGERLVEVKCGRLGVVEYVPMGKIRETVQGLLERL